MHPLIICLALFLAAPPVAADQACQAIDGTSVRAIWEAANFLNPEWLTSQPVFIKQGDSYVGTSSLDAKGAGREPIGLEMMWTVSLVDQERSSLEQHFSLPPASKFLVTCTFTQRGKSVETYTVLTDQYGALASQHIGYKDQQGRFFPETTSLDARVLESLGIRGPFVRTIVVPAEN